VTRNKTASGTSYAAAGDAGNPALVLLHGLGSDCLMWKNQMEPFAAQGYRVVAPDLLGHGESPKVETLTLDDWAGQIVELARELALSRFTLAGISMGGVIAQHFAVKHESMIARLSICDSFSDLSRPVDRLLGSMQLAAFPVFRLMGPKAFAKAMISAYKADYAAQAREYLYEACLRADFSQLALARKAINGVRALDALRSFKAPTQVLVGDQFGGYFINMNRKIADAIPGARFTVIENSMDPSCLVQPEAYNRLVLDFLK
jgi:3-oxoadipate enol-lactonase